MKKWKKWKKEAEKWFTNYIKLRDRYYFDMGKIQASWENFDSDLQELMKKCESEG